MRSRANKMLFFFSVKSASVSANENLLFFFPCFFAIFSINRSPLLVKKISLLFFCREFCGASLLLELSRILHKHTRTKNNLIITNMSAALTSSTFVGAKVSVAKTTTASKRVAFSVQANASGPKKVRIPISFFFCALKKSSSSLVSGGWWCVQILHFVQRESEIAHDFSPKRRWSGRVRVLETIDARVFRCESSLRTQLRAFLSVSTFARRRSTTRDRFRILFYFLRVFIWYAPLRPSSYRGGSILLEEAVQKTTKSVLPLSWGKKRKIKYRFVVVCLLWATTLTTTITDKIDDIFSSLHHNRVPNPRVAKPVSATRVPPKPVPPRRDATVRLATSTPWASATARRTSTNTPRSTYRKNSRRTATSTKVTCCTGRLRSPVSSVPVRSPSTWLPPCKKFEREKGRRGENFCRTKCFSKQE